MRYLFTILCLLSLQSGGYFPHILQEPIEQKEPSIVMLLDEEEIEEDYDHLPTLIVRIKEEDFHEQQVVYYDAEKKEEVSIATAWEKRESDYVLTWTFPQALKDTYLCVKDRKEVLLQSKSFTIQEDEKMPSFSIEGYVLEGKQLFAYDKPITLHVQFPSVMDENKTWISWNGKKLVLAWNEEKDSADFVLDEEGESTLSYTMKDMQGKTHTKESEFRILMDQQIPKVQVYFNEELIQKNPEERYATYINVEIEVSDNSFDEANSSVLINHKKKELEWKKQDHTYTAAFVIKDGSYTMSYELRDKAHHLTSASFSTFMVDSQAPKLKIERTYAMNVLHQQIHMEVEDASLEETQTLLYVEHDGHTQILHPEWMRVDNSLIYDVSFDQEGSYEVVAVATDLLKHSTTSEAIRFVIDKTAPVLSLKLNQKTQSGSKQFLTNRSIRVEAAVEDAHLYQKGIELYKNGVLVFQKENWEVFEVKAEVKKNNVYELVLYGEDEAGNRKEQHFPFAIYTKMESIHIANDIFHGAPSSKSWTPQLASNDKDVHVIQAVLYRNHELEEYHWGDEINKEGNYTLEIMAEDEAGNRCWMKPSFTFVIDKTPPTTALIHQNLQQEVTDKVTVHDSFYLMLEPYDANLQQQGKFTYVRVNGKDIAMLEEQRAALRFDSAGMYHIEAGVIDSAGNHKDYQWTVQAVKENVDYAPVRKPIRSSQKPTSKKEKGFHCLPIVLIGVVVVSGICFYVRKRKN